jgi:hypothetical protein
MSQSSCSSSRRRSPRCSGLSSVKPHCLPVMKDTDVLADEAPLGDRHSPYCRNVTAVDLARRRHGHLSQALSRHDDFNLLCVFRKWSLARMRIVVSGCRSHFKMNGRTSIVPAGLRCGGARSIEAIPKYSPIVESTSAGTPIALSMVTGNVTTTATTSTVQISHQ